MNDMFSDPWALVDHIVKNWSALTGLPKRMMREEGHFPEEVWKLVKKNNIDPVDFQDAWTEYFG